MRTGTCRVKEPGLVVGGTEREIALGTDVGSQLSTRGREPAAGGGVTGATVMDGLGAGLVVGSSLAIVGVGLGVGPGVGETSDGVERLGPGLPQPVTASAIVTAAARARARQERH
jgi:hypothetical protein